MTTPTDRESVKKLAARLSKPQSAIRPTVSDGRAAADTLLALRAALDAAEAERDALRKRVKAADRLARAVTRSKQAANFPAVADALAVYLALAQITGETDG